MRLDDVLNDLKINILPTHQICQFISKTEPTEGQLQPNSVIRCISLMRTGKLKRSREPR
jgi:hypothetical protein